MTETQRLIRIVKDLASEDGENTEYDRACAEILTDFLGFPMESKLTVLALARGDELDVP